MSIIKRTVDRLHDRACSCSEKQHLSLYHKHSAAIFEKGHKSILAYGRNHKACILRGSNEGKQCFEERKKYKVSRQASKNCSCRTGLYKQLPIREKDKYHNIKTLYCCNSSSSNFRRTADV